MSKIICIAFFFFFHESISQQGKYPPPLAAIEKSSWSTWSWRGDYVITSLKNSKIVGSYLVLEWPLRAKQCFMVFLHHRVIKKGNKLLCPSQKFGQLSEFAFFEGVENFRKKIVKNHKKTFSDYIKTSRWLILCFGWWKCVTWC